MSGKRLLLSPRERSNSLMGSKRALLASPNAADAAESNNDSADHFHVAGKRYKRKRPRVDDMLPASVSRTGNVNNTSIHTRKMALLEESCVWQGAKGGSGISVSEADVGRYLKISKNFQNLCVACTVP